MEAHVEAFERTMKALGRSDNTIRAYLGWLRRFAAFVGRPLEDVVFADLQEYQRLWRRIGESTSRRSIRHSALRLFYRACLERDWDFAGLPVQKRARRLPEVLSVEEVAALLGACSNLKHRAVMMTAYGCRLRLSETLALRPEHVDGRRMVIRVEQGKGRPLSMKTIQPVFRQTREKAGIVKAVSFHSLRHAFATHLLEDGTNVRVIQALPGRRPRPLTAVL